MSSLNPLVTQAVEPPPLIAEQVLIAYQKVHTKIEGVQNQVDHIIQKNEAEFLLAYRTHLEKIKRQLGDIKRKSEDQEKMFSSNDRIKYLENQVSLFRDQACRVYDKLEKTAKELELYKKKYEEKANLYTYAENSRKELVKQNKKLIASQAQLQQKMQALKQQICQQPTMPASVPQSVPSSITHDQSLPLQSPPHQPVAPQSQTSAIRKSQHSELKKSQKSQQSPQKESLLKSQTSQNRYSQLEKKSLKCLESSQAETGRSVRKSDTRPVLDDAGLKDLLIQCVRKVKREIGDRKGFANLDLRGISLDGFRELDKVRVLFYFFSNPDMELFLYDKMFPNHFLNKLEGRPSSKDKDREKDKMLLTSTGFELPRFRSKHRKYASRLQDQNRTYL